MSSVKVAGIWKDLSSLEVKVSGVWKGIDVAYVKVGGVWKDVFQAYTYAWETGSYGDCNVSCGGGTQTRTVVCKRSDGVTVSDTLCSEAKPDVSQVCNTHVCISCLYNASLSRWDADECNNCTTIKWQGSLVASFGGFTATSHTAGGYLYTRSTLQSNYGDFEECMEYGDPFGSLYRVCRQPI